MAGRPPVTGGPPHSEPGHKNWYIATEPSPKNPAQDGWFQAGLGASDIEMPLIEEQIRKECVKSGILKVLILDGTTSREPYRKAQDSILQALQTVSATHEINLKNVPDKWLIAWTRFYIQKEWQHSRDEAARDQRAREDANEARRRKGIKGTICGMDINVTIPPPGGHYLQGIVDLKFPSVFCVPSDLKLSLQDLKNYHLPLMRKEMEQAYSYIHKTESQQLPITLNARHGQLSYQRTADSHKDIERQQNFETALTDLHHNRRDDDDVLQFYFNLESESQKKAREGREAAAQRTRDQMQANRVALAKLAGEELKATPTRVERLVRETPRPSTSMGVNVNLGRQPVATSLQARRMEDEAVLAGRTRPQSQQTPLRTLRPRPTSQQVSRTKPEDTATKPKPRPSSHQPPPPSTSPRATEPPKRFVPIKHQPRPQPPAIPVQESSFSSEGSFKTQTSSSNGPITTLKRDLKRASNVLTSTAKNVVGLALHPREKAMARTVSAKGLKDSRVHGESQNGLPSVWRDEWSEVAPGVKGRRERRRRRRRRDEPDRWEKNDVFMRGLWVEEDVRAFAKGVGKEGDGDGEMEGWFEDEGRELEEGFRRLGDSIDEERSGEVRDLGGEDEVPQDEEFLVAELRRLQNREELSQIRPLRADRDEFEPPSNLERWKACCAMFQIEYTKIGIDETVTIAGLKKPLYQYQAFGVWWQMYTSRRLGGGIVGDEMGLGKTLSFLAYMVVERQLAVLWEDIDKSRKGTDGKPDGRHLSLTAAPNTIFRCPSADSRGPGWIACPCLPQSPTRQMRAMPGCRLAIVPPTLINQWHTQWEAHIDEEQKDIGMRIAIAKAGFFDANDRLNINDAKHGVNLGRLSALRVPKSEGGPLGSGPDEPKPGMERVLLLTTAKDYKSWVIKAFSYDGYIEKISGKLGQKREWVKGKKHGITFGIAMIDECHEDYLKGKGRPEILAQLNPLLKPFIWGYSGTPLPNTPRGMEGILWAMEQIKEKAPGHGATGKASVELLRMDSSYLGNICKEFESKVKKGFGYRDLMPDLPKRLLPYLYHFMIRRQADTLWFNRPLIKLKPHYHQDIFLKHREDSKWIDFVNQYKPKVELEKNAKLVVVQAEWDKKDEAAKARESRPTKLSFNATCQAEAHLRILATFPFLVTHLIGQNHTRRLNEKLELTTKECMQWRSAKEEKKSPYFRNLSDIVETSAKCAWLYQFIRQMLKGSPTIKVNGKWVKREHKLVIITSFSVVGLILKLFIQQYLPNTTNRVGIIYQGLPPRARANVIDAFTDAMDPETNQRKSKENYQFIIGPPRLLGQGHQLTRASNIILMEPDYDFTRELQAYARINRIGQESEETRSYRLVNFGSEVEQRIVKRQVDREEVFGVKINAHDVGTMDVEEVEEITGFREKVEAKDKERRKFTRRAQGDLRGSFQQGEFLSEGSMFEEKRNQILEEKEEDGEAEEVVEWRERDTDEVVHQRGLEQVEGWLESSDQFEGGKEGGPIL